MWVWVGTFGGNVSASSNLSIYLSENTVAGLFLGGLDWIGFAFGVHDGEWRVKDR